MVRLRRSAPDEPGIRRRRHGRGFSYVDARGRRVTEAEALDRIAGLSIPPAWGQVWICASENGHLQATGVDADGRTQYRYHPQWTARADRTKYERVRLLSESISGLRARVTRDLRSDEPDRRAIAIAVRLIDVTGMRLGDERYARERGTIGALTLERQHTVVSGSTVRLDFAAKSGVRWLAEIVDADLAAAIRQTPRGPASHLASWRDVATGVHRVRAEVLTAYLRDGTGLPVTAKDLRTLLGSRVAAQSLARAEPTNTAKQQDSRIRDAVVAVSEALRNTVAVARSSYIDPRVLERYRRGRVAELSAGRVSDAALARLITNE
ncbi:MAG: DNA topoisomerase IB [Microcella sp.]|nr:DNA topoisomerase IB [Microcella sp.]